MCFGGGSQAVAPVTTPSQSPQDAYQAVQQTSAPVVPLEKTAAPQSSVPTVKGM